MVVDAILTAVAEYEALSDRGLVLHAAHNVMSPAARALLASRLIDGELGGRSKMTGDQYGAGPIRAIEQIAHTLVERLFRTPYAELRPLSGSVSNALASLAVTKPGDTVLMPPEWAFGHKSLGSRGILGTAGRRIVEMPWDGRLLGPDLDAIRPLLAKERPRLVTLGLSRPLFPEPMGTVAALAHESGATLLYDGAHVLGLIAGKAFPNPLAEGFDVLTGSTHKTLPGPSGGIVLCRDAGALDAMQTLGDVLLSSYNHSRIAALAHTLAEMEASGATYASSVVENARILGRALHAAGFTVVGADRGYTATHQVILDITDLLPPAEAFTRLVEARIAINPPVRADRRLRDGRADGWWVRLGTPVTSRLGMTSTEMEAIASILGRLLLTRESPATVARSVTELAGAFRTVHYALEPDQAKAVAR